MFKALLKTRLSAMFASLFSRSKLKKSGAGSKLLYGVLFIYVLACFIFLFAMQYSELVTPLVEGGLTWLYFAYAGIASFALCFIGSVFTAQSQLYEAKDNDLLLSMPIPPRMILGVRMLLLLLINLAFSALVLGTAGVIYLTRYPATAAGILGFIGASIAMPFLGLALSCVLGWVLAVVSARIRKKSLVQMILSLGFLAAYFVVIMNMNEYLTTLLQNSGAIGQTIQASVFPIYHFGLAASGNLTSLLLFALCAFVPFAAVYFVLSKTFIRVVTNKRGFSKIKYEKKEMKVSSPLRALVQKDLKHFTGNSMYMMNAGLGVIFVLVIPVLYLFNRETVSQLTAQLPQLKTEMGLIAAAILCISSSMNTISAPSISLEGKSLWIVRSVPVKSSSVLLAKAYAHMAVAVPPALLASVVLAATLPLPLSERVLLVLITLLFNVVCALLGVVYNLRFPKFDWINETVCVKQSFSAFLAMFGGAGLIIAPGLLYVLALYGKIGGTLFMLLYLVVLLAIAAISVRYLKHGGVKRFENLQG